MKKQLLGAVALIAIAASAAFADVPNDPQTLALGAMIDNNSFDRAQLAIGNQVQYWQPVFDTLLNASPKGVIEPNVATAWSYNDDNNVLSLTLRAGLKFTDGTPLDATAVKANLEYLAKGNGANSYMARTISEVEVISPTELKLHLSAPDPALLFDLTTVGGALASPATLGVPGSDANPVGSGPYVYDAAASTPGRQYVFRRNKDYWNPAAYPYDQVTLTPISDAVARLNALRTGQIDGAIASTKEVNEAKAAGLTVTQGDVNFMGLTLADREGKLNPALGDKRVRQAINMAFDRASILKFLDQGYGKVTDQIFATTSAAYDPALEGAYTYDPAGAKKLLAEAGYANGLTLVLPEIKPFAAFDPIVTDQLKAIGITATFERLPPGSALPVIRSGKYGIFIFTFASLNPWTDFAQYLAPDAPYNPLKVNDPALMKLIHEAQFAKGDDQVAKFKAVNRYVVENAWFAPWYRLYTIYLTGADTAVDMQPGNAVPYIRDYHPAR